MMQNGTANLPQQSIQPGNEAALGKAPGAYVLALRLDRPVSFSLPRMDVSLPEGWYFYAGNAYGPGGMASRLRRHFRREKKTHWHIDRLTTQANRIMAFAFESGDECALAARLLASGQFIIAMQGFGSTDCSTCESHLLRPNTPIPASGPANLPL